VGQARHGFSPIILRGETRESGGWRSLQWPVNAKVGCQMRITWARIQNWCTAIKTWKEKGEIKIQNT
jgi:hypothetical protein